MIKCSVSKPLKPINCIDPNTGREAKSCTNHNMQNVLFALLEDIVYKIPKHIPKNIVVFEEIMANELP